MTTRRATRGHGAKCPDCRTALSHCHHALVRHADGTLECTQGPGCEERLDRHELVISCAELERCDCLDAEARG